ncbi:MAG: Rpn family recombination-promoting nuclease/putative transposase [Spirochaetaceae bacterium]|nr:Rpn family recombination-promoting nuclease/putative transposase [Spirochaetaceae bacterium]
MKKSESMENAIIINREHKDSLFTFLFNNPAALKELYSAIEGINLSPDTPIDINTLTGILIRGQLNDVSFTIDNRLVVLIEHMSTISDNLPLRLLMYIGRLYESIIDDEKRYQRKLEKIPSPEFIVLYNGKEKFPDHKELRLSSAFQNTEDLKLSKNKIPLELIVQVYNINQGYNQEILSKSKTLDSYSILISKIWEYQKEKISLEESLKYAIKYCIENNILRDFLKRHSSEVYNMLFGEWDFEKEKAVAAREAREDGLSEGRTEGIAQGRVERDRVIAMNALAKGLTPELVCDITGLDLETIQSLSSK